MKFPRWPLLSLLLPLLMAGVGPGPIPPDSFSLVAPGPAVFISAPRQSLPAPVHDEATCAFCQAAAFAPYASSPACGIPEASSSEHQELTSRDDRLPHFGSSRPPSTRAPPTLRDV
jgi:hypothetical protein